MKRYLLILFLSFCTVFTGFAQVEDDGVDEVSGNKLQERMKMYIQKRLGLSKSQAERFSPVFIRYIVELRRTHREFKQDKPMLQFKVGELRLRFRNEFRQIMDEQRANRVYEIQREFELKIVDELKQRVKENRTRPKNRSRALQLD